MIKVVYGVHTNRKLTEMIDKLDLFETPFHLVSHIDGKHRFLPLQILEDQLKQLSNLSMAVKPPIKCLESYKEYKYFTYNLYKDLTSKEDDFNEYADDETMRNHGFLIYCYGGISIQLDNHIKHDLLYPDAAIDRKFKAVEEYLSNLLLMVSKDEFEVCGNGECLTEYDRIEFAKFQLIRLIIINFKGRL